MLLDPHLHSL